MPIHFSRPVSREAVLVWGSWSVLTVAALAYVAAFGVNIPWGDELDSLVPLFTDKLPLTLRSLWQQHNEHHIALPKLIWVLMGSWTAYDLRAGMMLNVTLLAFVSALLMAAVRHARGQSHWADCLIPIALLSWGHNLNLLWSIQLAYVLNVVLVCVVLAVFLRSSGSPSSRSIAVVGACLLAMPLTLAAGVLVAPCLSLWLAWTAVQDWREHRRSRSAILALVIAAVFAVAGASFVDRDSIAASVSVSAVLVDGVKLMSMSFGPTVRNLRYILPLITLLAVSAAGVVLMKSLRLRRHERFRSFGLLLTLIALAVLSFGIAYGRSGLVPDAVYAARYSILLAPLLITVYAAFALYGRARFQTIVAPALAVMACALLPFNMKDGYRCGVWLRPLAEVERDVKAGVPLEAVVARHWSKLYPVEERVRQRLIELQQAGIGCFRYLKVDSPQCRETVCDAVGVESSDMHALQPLPHGTKTKSLRYALDESCFVEAVRLIVTAHVQPAHDHPQIAQFLTPRLKLSWKHSAADAYDDNRAAAAAMTTLTEATPLTIWVHDHVAEFTLAWPAEGCGLEIQEVRLLRPVSEIQPAIARQDRRGQGRR